MEPPTGPETRIVLRSSVTETARLHAWLDALFAVAPTALRLENAVRLCLEEAVMNVIMHGYGEGAPGELEISLCRGDGGLCARVSDGAPPFDPLATPLLQTHRLSLQDGPLGGRGLLLLRRFATTLAYERADGRNQLTLRFAD